MRRLRPKDHRITPNSDEGIQPEEDFFRDDSKTISRRNLINLLNRINFKGSTILLNFKHPKYDRVVPVQAVPMPYHGDKLQCHWHNYNEDLISKIKQYEFLHFQINSGLNQVLVEADLVDMDQEGVRLNLPRHCYEITARKVKRYQCDGIYAQISQSGVVFYGLLSAFSSTSFTIDITMVSSELLNRVNPSSSVNIILKNERDVVYSGECEVIRLKYNNRIYSLALRPLTSHMQRFKPKECRTKRQILSPSPNCIFKHPITDKTINLKIVNLSSTGFLVKEKIGNSVLLPGLILYDVGIEYANDLIITADVQVLYRAEGKSGIVKCGIVILDLSVQDQIRISSLLLQDVYEHSSVCSTQLDLDALWNFFFDTGFVYPEKYVFIEGQKEKFKTLYHKLYTECPEIARYIIYQDMGVIYGHVAMIRYYPKTWLLHHYAAVSAGDRKAGLIIMDHILNYINAFHKMPSANMRYIACYYRPVNRFAKRVFSGSVKALNDPQKCSMDEFAYLHHKVDSVKRQIGESWVLEESVYEDFIALEQYYNHVSRGLLFKAFSLDQWKQDNDKQLNSEYHKLGFKRNRHFFSLKKEGELYAVFIINLSDIGLNMSDLTNCIQVYILEPEKLHKDKLEEAISQVSFYYEQNEFPVLIYPSTYADKQTLPYDKVYELGILDLEYICPYLTFIQGLISHPKQKISKLH